MWYYSENGQQAGPISDEELKTRAEQGLLKPDDQIWKEGMKAWAAAKSIKGLFAVAPPPLTPAVPSGPPPLASEKASPLAQLSSISSNLSGNPKIATMLDPKNRVLMGYRIGFVLAIISTLMSWANGAGSASGGGFSFSGSASMMGLESLWGVLVALIAGAGLFFSFRKPLKFLKDDARYSMASFGAMIVLCAMIGMFMASSAFAGNNSFSSSFGNSSSSAKAGAGVFLAIVSGIVISIMGYIQNWDTNEV